MFTGYLNVFCGVFYLLAFVVLIWILFVSWNQKFAAGITQDTSTHNRCLLCCPVIIKILQVRQLPQANILMITLRVSQPQNENFSKLMGLMMTSIITLTLFAHWQQGFRYLLCVLACYGIPTRNFNDFLKLHCSCSIAHFEKHTTQSISASQTH